MKLQLRRQLTEELKQKQAITDSLIQKILYSKRLLVDHVEALEHCLLLMAENVDMVDAKTSKPAAGKISRTKSPMKPASPEIFTARNACVLLGGTILEHIVTPKSMRLTLIPSLFLAGGFGAIYFVKNMFVFRNKLAESELEQLIRTIDDFGNCIRRNMTYFSEIIVMKQQELIESRQIERAWDCITATKEVTEILYDAMRKLEAQYPLPAKFAQHYSPMEELRECDHFKNNITDYSPQHIKEFHNIFAYVQSQFLLRLALTIATKPSISQLKDDLMKVDCLIRQLVNEEENHFRNLTIEMNKKQQIEIESLHTTKAMQNRSGPIAMLQDSSLKLSALMVAVAGECQSLDITLQRLTEAEAGKKDNTKQLVEVANSMRSIEGALSLCCDNFQRLMLVYSKFLSSKIDEEDNKNQKAAESEAEKTDNEFPDSILRVEISDNQNSNASDDEFYAYMFDEQQAKVEEEAAQKAKAQQQTYDMEILNFEKRITKGKFRPVLKQLKNRINPIRQVMLDKERQVLAAKGFNVDELFAQEDEEEKDEENVKEEAAEKSAKENPNVKQINGSTKHADNENSDDSEGSADLEYSKRTKKLKERDNFAEMRNFLAQKEAINIFQTQLPVPPISAVGKEEILESEDVLDSPEVSESEC